MADETGLEGLVALRAGTRSATVDELDIIRTAVRCVPTVVVVVLLLDLLTEEYVRLMELMGLIRRRGSTEPDGGQQKPSK